LDANYLSVCTLPLIVVFGLLLHKGKARADTSERVAAYLHLSALYQTDQATTPPTPLITGNVNTRPVILDIGGDPTRVISNYVEQDYDNTIQCIPLNPIEAPQEYTAGRKLIDFDKKTFSGEPIQFVTSISILNVIADKDIRHNHIKECFEYLGDGGCCFFKVWKSNNHFTHTINRDIASYKDEILAGYQAVHPAGGEKDMSLVDDTLVIRVHTNEQITERSFTVKSYNGALPIEGRATNNTVVFNLADGYNDDIGKIYP